ncbi:hypothetical protein AVEN_75790-1 [Araneus ventricosus]|uniref:Uncharacterized protein n=1 Tax=Araneus ventricosus TaxID=182803 RepID=A0A4Y2PUC8_ARAVE|nr:hypothetical protein AVEN_75790-1 [Araneus ventricosus]
MTRTTPELEFPFPNIHTRQQGCVRPLRMISRATGAIHGGVESGFEPGTLRPRSRKIATIPPRSQDTAENYLYRFRLHHSDICAHVEKGDPLHYATSCHLFILPNRAGNTLLWWKNLLLNKLSRIKIAKLISFITDNKDLIKQPPDATSSSDSAPDFSPSPRPQTDGLRPYRGSIPRTLISPPTSF